MDKESTRKRFITLLEDLKKLGVPQQDLDKAILDFDLLAGETEDVEKLKNFSNDLVDNIKYTNNLKRNNPDGSVTEQFPNMEVNRNVPIEEFNLDIPRAEMPDILSDIEKSNEYARMKSIKTWAEGDIKNSKFGQVVLNRYNIFANFVENANLSTEQKQKLLEKVNNDIINLDEKYRKIVVQTDVEMSLEDMNKMEAQLASDIADYEAVLQSDLDGMKIKNMDINTPGSDEALEQMQWEDDNRSTANWPPDQYEGEGPIDKISEQYESSIEPRPGEVDNFIDNEFNQIINSYQTGDISDEEIQQLIDEEKLQPETQSKIQDAKAQYDADVAETANQLGITDTKAFKTLVQVGAKLLNAIDEELIYSPLLLAEKGLKALGLAVPGKAIGGLGRAAMAYEGYLFKAQLGLAALSQGATAMAGGASRLPGEIANGILNLYGAGMPEGLAPDVETGMSKEEQAKRQEMMFYNQMYQYSRLSPSLRLFTDVIGPKTGTYDVIQGYKTGFDRFSKMLGGNK